MKGAKTVDEYLINHPEYQEELTTLRQIFLSTELEETIKWGAPIYTYKGKNIAGLGAFKSYVGIWFHQGALLSDPENKLINAQEGKTKALRQWRFANHQEIDKKLIQQYVNEAIQHVVSGKEIKPARNQPLFIPPELNEAISADASVAEGFEALSLSKKRDYAEYIETAKRQETKSKRMEKILPMIREKKGLHDQYKRK